VYRSLCAQLKDAATQAGFTDIVLGLSGGIDSALAAALACDTLGAGRVHGIIMPAPCTAPSSVPDALDLAHNLGMKTITIPIDSILAEYDTMLETPMYGLDVSRMRQNIQARIRANILMAFSNQFGWMVLCTSNRSELMVGYTTLYGDTVGACAPLAPLYKGWVYELAHLRNANGAVIPDEILAKAPSAELESGQTDEAELGPYKTLDSVLYHIDQGMSAEDLCAAGFDEEVVAHITDRIAQAQFKHRFEPPGATLHTENEHTTP
jgi:NAD+ synthetase